MTFVSNVADGVERSFSLPLLLACTPNDSMIVELPPHPVVAALARLQRMSRKGTRAHADKNPWKMDGKRKLASRITKRFHANAKGRRQTRSSARMPTTSVVTCSLAFSARRHILFDSQSNMSSFAQTRTQIQKFVSDKQTTQTESNHRSARLAPSSRFVSALPFFLP